MDEPKETETMDEPKETETQWMSQQKQRHCFSNKKQRHTILAIPGLRLTFITLKTLGLKQNFENNKQVEKKRKKGIDISYYCSFCIKFIFKTLLKIKVCHN